MWTLAVVFCSLTGADAGLCVSAAPPMVFQTYEECEKFAIAETTSINLEAVSYDYQCIQWLDKI